MGDMEDKPETMAEYTERVHTLLTALGMGPMLDTLAHECERRYEDTRDMPRLSWGNEQNRAYVKLFALLSAAAEYARTLENSAALLWD
jgi:hypothetical protein